MYILHRHVSAWISVCLSVYFQTLVSSESSIRNMENKISLSVSLSPSHPGLELTPTVSDPKWHVSVLLGLSHFKSTWSKWSGTGSSEGTELLLSLQALLSPGQPNKSSEFRAIDLYSTFPYTPPSWGGGAAVARKGGFCSSSPSQAMQDPPLSWATGIGFKFLTRPVSKDLPHPVVSTDTNILPPVRRGMKSVGIGRKQGPMPMPSTRCSKQSPPSG